MIRMGRSSKPEAGDTSLHTTNPSASYPVGTVPSISGNRAVTESESMARDIKEGRLSGFIGSGTVLTGETSFQTMLRIDGHLTGSVSSDTGTLIVGATGRVDANVQVASATINGTVNGDISVLEKLELGRTARVVGNIQAPRLVIEDGAILEGSCNMVRAKENLEKRAAETGRAKINAAPAPFEADETPLYIEPSNNGNDERADANIN